MTRSSTRRTICSIDCSTSRSNHSRSSRVPLPNNGAGSPLGPDVGRSVSLRSVSDRSAVAPVGAPLVWIPASLWLLTQGHTGSGIFMALYGALVISSVDNFIRPWAISRGANLPLLLTLLGALGGVFAFGFLGLFLGPVVLAVGYTLMLEFAGAEEEEPQGPSPPATGAV